MLGARGHWVSPRKIRGQDIRRILYSGGNVSTQGTKETNGGGSQRIKTKNLQWGDLKGGILTLLSTNGQFGVVWQLKSIWGKKRAEEGERKAPILTHKNECKVSSKKGHYEFRLLELDGG